MLQDVVQTDMGEGVVELVKAMCEDGEPEVPSVRIVPLRESPRRRRRSQFKTA